MGKPNRGGLGKPLGWGEGWKGSHSAADSHILFLEIRREFGGHKNFVLHPPQSFSEPSNNSGQIPTERDHLRTVKISVCGLHEAGCAERRDAK
jgi:hypothetical protein